MKMIQKSLIFMLISSIVLIAGCGEKAEEAKVGQTPAAIETVTPEAAFAAQSLTDDTKASLVFPEKVERIVCLTSICIDILAELGLEPVAIGEAGVRAIATAAEFFGDKGKSFASIGGSFYEPNLEEIVTAKPDLVIGLKNAHEALRAGLKDAAPLYLTWPTSYKQSIDLLEAVGKLTGKTEAAEAAKQKFLAKLAFYKEKSPKNKRALVFFGSDLNIYINASSGLTGSLMAEVTDYPWPVTDAKLDEYGDGGIAYSLDKVLEKDPDVLFVESYSYSPGTKPVSEQLKATPLWSKLKAVKNGQVYEVRSPIWGDGRGTRSLGITLDESMKILYPDVFKDGAQQ